ncbi:MAG TPA: hypothetical protein VLK33_19810 [Terriglobales bacterium]|nr:hypothetical protein [Terriglobales bacterium]
MSHFYLAYPEAIILNSKGQPKPIDFKPYTDQDERPLIFADLKDAVKYVKDQGDTPFVPATKPERNLN